MQLKYSKSSGFSIVSVMVSLAIIALVLLSVTSTMNFSLSSKKSIESTRKVSLYQTRLIEDLKTILQEKVIDTRKCIDYKKAFQHKSLNIKYYEASYKYRDNSESNSFVKRCRKPTPYRAKYSDMKNPNKNRLHFCAQFSNLTEVFPSADKAFIEISAFLKDFSSNRNISCKDYISPPKKVLPVAEVYYTIYWKDKSSDNNQLKSTNGNFLIGKN